MPSHPDSFSDRYISRQSGCNATYHARHQMHCRCRSPSAILQIMKLRIYLSLILVTCVQKVCAIFLQSIGKAKAAAPLSVLRDVLLVVFSLLIPVFLGVTGIFLAAPVADVLAILATVAVMVQVWKEK